MHEHVSVRHPDLVTHAATISAAGDRVATAAAAGTTVRSSPEAYGKLCVMVPAMLGALQDALVNGIAAAADSLHDTAARLHTTAAAYAATDQRASDHIRSAGR
jgi:Excreted virulence factor EspC, type VII ESX diderm